MTPPKRIVAQHRKRVLEKVPPFLASIFGEDDEEPKACVTYSKLLAAALNKLGYEAEVVTAMYVIGNEQHIIGLGLNAKGGFDDEYFHAAVFLPDRKEIIDLTVTQASRPQFGIECTAFWSRQPPAFIKDAKIVFGIELPSKAYDSLEDPEAVVDALVEVIEGREIEVARWYIP